MKKLFSLFLILCMMFSLFACVKPGVEKEGEDENEDEDTTTRLNVYNYDGGIGTEWLENIAKEFEVAYADVSFAEGKKGVTVKVTPGKKTDIALSNSIYNVFFTEGVRYNSLAAQNLLLDISDLVTSSLSDVTNGAETCSIADKLSANKRASLTALNGNYYVLPHYETYDGIFFDVDVFEEYGLYFLDDGNFCDEDAFVDGVYTGSGKIACGPDGIFGTGDDGFASSYEEFDKLLDRMVKKGVVPFIWTGEYAESYMIKLINGAWAAYAGADEMSLNFTFGSGVPAEKSSATIVTSFEGETPVTAEKQITMATGYENSAQVGKYYGLRLLQKVLSNSSYYSKKITGVLSHLNAQEEFIYSNLENAPIAMIVEGSFWYNEASGAFARSINSYKERAQNRRFAMLQLPRQATGHVTEGNGTKNTLVDVLSSYAFINGNIADNAEKVAAAKAFLKFCYTDHAMKEFTFSTGIMKGLNYNISESEIAGLDYYKQYIIRMRQSSDVVAVMADNPLFVNNAVDFALEFAANTYTSTIGNATYMSPYATIKDGVSAKDYFVGTWVSASDWEKKYSSYYTK